MQGAGVPLQVSCQRRRLQLAVKPDLISLAYLRFFELLPKLFQFASTVVHDTSHKPFSLRIARLGSAFSRASETPVKQYKSPDPFALLFPHFPSHRGN